MSGAPYMTGVPPGINGMPSANGNMFYGAVSAAKGTAPPGTVSHQVASNAVGPNTASANSFGVVTTVYGHVEQRSMAAGAMGSGYYPPPNAYRRPAGMIDPKFGMMQQQHQYAMMARYYQQEQIMQQTQMNGPPDEQFMQSRHLRPPVPTMGQNGFPNASIGCPVSRGSGASHSVGPPVSHSLASTASMMRASAARPALDEAAAAAAVAAATVTATATATAMAFNNNHGGNGPAGEEIATGPDAYFNGTKPPGQPADPNWYHNPLKRGATHPPPYGLPPAASLRKIDSYPAPMGPDGGCYDPHAEQMMPPMHPPQSNPASQMRNSAEMAQFGPGRPVPMMPSNGIPMGPQQMAVAAAAGAMPYPMGTPTPPMTPGAALPMGSAPPPMERSEPRLIFPVPDGTLMNPFKLEHGNTSSHLTFFLRRDVYDKLTQRADLDLMLKCFHHEDQTAQTHWPSSVSVHINQNPVSFESFPTNGGPPTRNFAFVYQELMSAEPKFNVKQFCASRIPSEAAGDQGVPIDLRDPISQGTRRTRVPVRGAHCRHLQCFDLENYLLVNAFKPTWTCPICEQITPLEQLEIDQFLLGVQKSANDTSPDIERILVNGQGRWMPLPPAPPMVPGPMNAPHPVAMIPPHSMQAMGMVQQQHMVKAEVMSSPTMVAAAATKQEGYSLMCSPIGQTISATSPQMMPLPSVPTYGTMPTSTSVVVKSEPNVISSSDPVMTQPVDQQGAIAPTGNSLVPTSGPTTTQAAPDLPTPLSQMSEMTNELLMNGSGGGSGPGSKKFSPSFQSQNSTGSSSGGPNSNAPAPPSTVSTATSSAGQVNDSPSHAPPSTWMSPPPMAPPNPQPQQTTTVVPTTGTTEANTNSSSDSLSSSGGGDPAASCESNSATVPKSASNDLVDGTFGSEDELFGGISDNFFDNLTDFQLDPSENLLPENLSSDEVLSCLEATTDPCQTGSELFDFLNNLPPPAAAGGQGGTSSTSDAAGTAESSRGSSSPSQQPNSQSANSNAPSSIDGTDVGSSSVQ